MSFSKRLRLLCGIPLVDVVYEDIWICCPAEFSGISSFDSQSNYAPVGYETDVQSTKWWHWWTVRTHIEIKECNSKVMITGPRCLSAAHFSHSYEEEVCADPTVECPHLRPDLRLKAQVAARREVLQISDFEIRFGST
jgi:hypothetical protein